MSKASDLQSLLSRVMEAEGPDLKLFYDACVALAYNGVDDFEFHQYFWRMIDAGAWESAALSLLDRALPDALYRIEKKSPSVYRRPDHNFGATCWHAGEQEEADHVSPALALLAALLKAKATEEK